METTGPQPTPQEARETLARLAQDEHAVRYPPIPRWFFVVMAAAVAGLSLAQLLPSAAASTVTLAIAFVAILLGHRYWLNRDGVSWVSVDLGDMLPFLAAVLGIQAAGWLVSETTGIWWIWIPCAVANAVVVLVTGHRYVREYGHGG